jgi:hypothetical protein
LDAKVFPPFSLNLIISLAKKANKASSLSLHNNPWTLLKVTLVNNVTEGNFWKGKVNRRQETSFGSG